MKLFLNCKNSILDSWKECVFLIGPLFRECEIVRPMAKQDTNNNILKLLKCTSFITLRDVNPGFKINK